MPASARLRSLVAQLQPSSTAPAVAVLPTGSSARPRLLSDAAVQSFIMKGWMSIPPEEIGLPRAFHQTVYDKMSALHDEAVESGVEGGKKIGENTHSHTPEVYEVMRTPAVAGALQSILGEGYGLHPHTYTHIKHDVGFEQDWRECWSPSIALTRFSLTTCFSLSSHLALILLQTRMGSCHVTVTASVSTSRNTCC
jgi:hypothetical protein